VVETALSSPPRSDAARRRRSPPLAPLDARTLRRMLRYALETGADVLHLRPGSRPQVDGGGGPRELRFRQLAGDDTRAALGHLFAALEPSVRLRSAGAAGTGALSLPWLLHWPDTALLEVSVRPAQGGPALAVDIARPLPEAPALRADLPE